MNEQLAAGAEGRLARLVGPANARRSACTADVLTALVRLGPSCSQAVANEIWPDGCPNQWRRDGRWLRSTHGGPSGDLRAAACWLGRLEKRGLVRSGGDPAGAARYGTWGWRITDAGRALLQPNAQGQPTVPPPLRYGYTSADLERWARIGGDQE